MNFREACTRDHIKYDNEPEDLPLGWLGKGQFRQQGEREKIFSRFSALNAMSS